MCSYLEFNYKKATQTLNFFAIQEGGIIDKLKAIKLIYFADRYHLRKHSRFITNDEYYAMKLGPVASGVKDIAEMSTFLDDEELKYAENFLKLNGKFGIESTQDNFDNVFSESDIEALVFAWEKFGAKTKYELAEITHGYPEWKKHELKLKEHSRVRMRCEDFFEDPPDNYDKCHQLDVKEKVYMREHLKEMSHLDALWS